MSAPPQIPAPPVAEGLTPNRTLTVILGLLGLGILAVLAVVEPAGHSFFRGAGSRR
ncbi:MAG: hypothetical protein ACKPGI_04805 [Verrucomicrobiota bacterium]